MRTGMFKCRGWEEDAVVKTLEFSASQHSLSLDTFISCEFMTTRWWSFSLSVRGGMDYSGAGSSRLPLSVIRFILLSLFLLLFGHYNECAAKEPLDNPGILFSTSWWSSPSSSAYCLLGSRSRFIIMHVLFTWCKQNKKKERKKEFLTKRNKITPETWFVEQSLSDSDRLTTGCFESVSQTKQFGTSNTSSSSSRGGLSGWWGCVLRDSIRRLLVFFFSFLLGDMFWVMSFFSVRMISSSLFLPNHSFFLLLYCWLLP